VFQIRETVRRHGIELRSSNYELYSDLMFVTGSVYTKCGVMLEGMHAQGAAQADLFAKVAPRAGDLLSALDGLNQRFGRNTLRLAAEGQGVRSYDTKPGQKARLGRRAWLKFRSLDKCGLVAQIAEADSARTQTPLVRLRLVVHTFHDGRSQHAMKTHHSVSKSTSGLSWPIATSFGF
jgi:hypothetical protein